MNYKKKLFILEFLSVVFMLLPLIILILANKEYYLQKSSPIYLSIGIITALIFAIILVKSKMRLTDQRVLKFLLFFILCYIFEPFLENLKEISFMALIGQLINSIFFENKIKNLKKMIDAEFSAKIIVNQIGENTDAK